MAEINHNGLNIPSPPSSSYVEILISISNDIRRYLGYEGEALRSGISVLVREALESSMAPSPKWGLGEKAVAMNQGEDSHPNASMLVPWSWTSQPAEL